MASFPANDIKTFIREECLREENGKPRTKPDRVLRVLALIREDSDPDAAPLWHQIFEDGENDEDTVDVDGIVGKLQRKVDREVNAKKTEVMFRCVAIHGLDTAINPSTISAQFPFTVMPSRRVVADASDERSGYIQSMQEATSEKGWAGFALRQLKTMGEMMLPEIHNIIAQKDTTIDELRAQLQDERNENKTLRAERDEALDKRVERTIKLRDAALKQRMKERGGRLVMNAITMLASSYMSGGSIGGGGGGGQMTGGAPPAPKLGRGAGAAVNGKKESNGASGEGANGANGAGEAASEGSSEKQAPESKGEEDIVIRSAKAAKEGGAVDLDGVFGALIEEIMPVVGNLVGAVTPDQQALLMQAFQVHQESGKLDTLLMKRFAEDIAEGGDLKRLQILMSRLPSPRARMAFATIFHVLRTEYDRERQDERDLETDLNDRVDRVTSGEIEDDEPVVPDDPVEEIEVKDPKILTRKEAEEKRKKKTAKVKVDAKVVEKDDRKRPL